MTDFEMASFCDSQEQSQSTEMSNKEEELPVQTQNEENNEEDLNSLGVLTSDPTLIPKNKPLEMKIKNCNGLIAKKFCLRVSLLSRTLNLERMVNIPP